MPTQKVRYKKRSTGEAPEVGQLVRSPNAPSMRNRTVLTTGCRISSRCWFGMVVNLREVFCCPTLLSGARTKAYYRSLFETGAQKNTRPKGFLYKICKHGSECMWLNEFATDL